MSRTKNPFIDGVIAKGSEYCSRKDIEGRITTKIQNGHKLALIGDRRIGKTSTAHYVIDKEKGFHKLDIDLYHVTSATDVAESIIDSCHKVLSKVWDGKSLLDYMSKISPTLEISESGISLGISAKSDEYKKTLNIAFEFLEETKKRTKGKLIVLFDEFQAIREVRNGDSILKYMRGKIQKMGRMSIMYVGSIRHEMDHIFRDQSSPFYKQAEVIYFDHIERDIFYNFLFDRFNTKKIKFKREVYDYLYDICNGITGDIQTFCRVSFDTLEGSDILDFKNFFHIIEIIYKNEQKYFKSIIEGKELTKVQQNLLLHIAPYQGDESIQFFSQDFQKAIGVKSPGAVTNALNALKKKEYIYESEDQVYFSNPFFREWIMDYKLLIKAVVGKLTAGSPLAKTRLEMGYREQLIRENSE